MMCWLCRWLLVSAVVVLVVLAGLCVENVAAAEWGRLPGRCCPVSSNVCRAHLGRAGQRVVPAPIPLRRLLIVSVSGVGVGVGIVGLGMFLLVVVSICYVSRRGRCCCCCVCGLGVHLVLEKKMFFSWRMLSEGLAIYVPHVARSLLRVANAATID